LPPQQKLVFELAKKGGCSYAEIASRTGLSVETVRKYMKLALQSVRQYVQNHSQYLMLLLVFLSKK
jgi:RNA polymerase sigma-70 factor (ECF subfamily)